MGEIAAIYRCGAATMKIKTDFCEISESRREDRVREIEKTAGKILKSPEIEGCYRGKDEV